MSATRLICQGNATITTGSGVLNYLPAQTASSSGQTTEINRQVMYRTAGKLTNLMAIKLAGDRTTMTAKVRVNAGAGSGAIAFTSTNGLYEDTSGLDAITAGQKVAYELSGGTGGTTSLGTTACAIDWSATGTTTTKLGSHQPGSGASQTKYSAPAGATSTQTQADGEWLVKLPPGVDHVTLKNLYVYNGTAPTSAYTVSINGATGTGTAPTVSPSALNTAYEDTTNSIQAKDGDKISIKIVYGASTQGVSHTITFEVQSDDGVSFLVAGSAGGTFYAADGYVFLAGHSSGGSTTESNQQIPARGLALAKLSLLSAYVKTLGSGSPAVGLRSNAASVGSPGQVSVALTATGWVTDTANTFVVAAPTDLINYNESIGTGAPTITCLALTCQNFSLASAQMHRTSPRPNPAVSQAGGSF